MSTTIRTDVVVVGAGPIGIVTALELAKSGVQVALFESGLEHMDKAAQELAMNRSQLIRSAVEAFLRQRNRERLERAIAESFQANRDLDRQLAEEFRHVDADAEIGL